MIDLEPGFILAGLGTVFTGGAALAGVKFMVTGLREDVHEVKVDLSEHVKDDHEVQSQILDRLARIETKQDLLLEDRRHDSGSAS